jgi:hypothetical protein
VAEPTSSVSDPLSMWREWVAQSERQWNAFLNQAMGTDQYTQSMTRFMDLYLGMQRGLADCMGRYLATLNVATRTDMLALGDRLAAIEHRLGKIEREVCRPEPVGGAGETSVAPARRPPRTKKPPDR